MPIGAVENLIRQDICMRENHHEKLQIPHDSKYKSGFCGNCARWWLLRCGGRHKRICRWQIPTRSPIHILSDVGKEWVTFWKNIL
jgi:hypothetical protein